MEKDPDSNAAQTPREKFEDIDTKARAAVNELVEKYGITLSEAVRRHGLKGLFNLIREGLNTVDVVSHRQYLLERSEKEARALNEEYEQLKQQADEALRNLDDFEREKLGLYQNKDKRPQDA